MRELVNPSIIPGSLFRFGPGTPVYSGYPYQWFDPHGTVDSVYYLEADNADGTRKSYDSPVNVVANQTTESTSTISTGTTAIASPRSGLEEYPEGSKPVTSAGAIDTQWSVAAQSALKILINHDGWYRVTQQQETNAGFNPTVDIGNLLLFFPVDNVIGPCKIFNDVALPIHFLDLRREI